MKKGSVGAPYSGVVMAIKKEVSLARSQSDICQRNRPPPGDDVLRPTVSTNELGKLKVCVFIYSSFLLILVTVSLVCLAVSRKCINFA